MAEKTKRTAEAEANIEVRYGRPLLEQARKLKAELLKWFGDTHPDILPRRVALTLALIEWGVDEALLHRQASILDALKRGHIKFNEGSGSAQLIGWHEAPYCRACRMFLKSCSCKRAVHGQLRRMVSVTVRRRKDETLEAMLWRAVAKLSRLELQGNAAEMTERIERRRFRELRKLLHTADEKRKH